MRDICFKIESAVKEGGAGLEAARELLSNLERIVAKTILAIGKSSAESYELAVKAIGSDNFTRYKITEELAKGNVKLIPDVLISGSNVNGTAVEGILGLKLMEMLDPINKK